MLGPRTDRIGQTVVVWSVKNDRNKQGPIHGYHARPGHTVLRNSNLRSDQDQTTGHQHVKAKRNDAIGSSTHDSEDPTGLASPQYLPTAQLGCKRPVVPNVGKKRGTIVKPSAGPRSQASSSHGKSSPPRRSRVIRIRKRMPPVPVAEGD